MTEEKKAKTNKPTAKRKQGKADNAATPEVQKPAPLSELEQRARKFALQGIRILRRAYYLADFGDYDDDELKKAGAWGAAYAKVCEALWRLYWMQDEDEIQDADNAIGELEKAEKQAKLRWYCEKRKAAMKAEMEKAIAEGRAHELVKYYPKTGRCVWRKAKA